MGNHINKEGKFQSDKYPTCPAGKVPLSVEDTSAQDLLWEYAQRRRLVDAEFSEDLETCLHNAGYTRPVVKVGQIYKGPRNGRMYVVMRYEHNSGYDVVLWNIAFNQEDTAASWCMTEQNGWKLVQDAKPLNRPHG